MDFGRSFHRLHMIHIDPRYSRATLTPDVIERCRTFAKNPLPAFAAYAPNLAKLSKQLAPYKKFKQFILIGRGGSTAPFEAFYRSQQNAKTKTVHVLKTTAPDRIREIQKTTNPKNTLVLAISKSGETVDVLEDLLSFQKYPVLCVTEPNKKTLHQIQQKMGFGLIPHPPVGGRYSGGTECALVPLLLSGTDAKKILSGIQKSNKRFGLQTPYEKNPALQTAAHLYSLYQNGFDEWFAPVYSPRLSAFAEVATQLVHESLAKQTHGITFVTAEAPQSQHHTNQRFFGGPSNMIGLFVTEQSFDAPNQKLKVQKAIANIPLRDSTVGLLQGYTLADSMNYEFLGTFQNAIAKEKPVVHIRVSDAGAESAGELYGFLEWLVVYTGWLIGINPFDQPDVEASKQISEQLRRTHNA